MELSEYAKQCLDETVAADPSSPPDTVHVRCAVTTEMKPGEHKSYLTMDAIVDARVHHPEDTMAYIPAQHRQLGSAYAVQIGISETRLEDFLNEVDALTGDLTYIGEYFLTGFDEIVQRTGHIGSILYLESLGSGTDEEATAWDWFAARSLIEITSRFNDETLIMWLGDPFDERPVRHLGLTPWIDHSFDMLFLRYSGMTNVTEL